MKYNINYEYIFESIFSGGNGPMHYGVCSNYLKDCNTGEMLHLFVRRSVQVHEKSHLCWINLKLIDFCFVLQCSKFSFAWRHHKACDHGRPWHRNCTFPRLLGATTSRAHSKSQRSIQGWTNVAVLRMPTARTRPLSRREGFNAGDWSLAACVSRTVQGIGYSKGE